MNKVHGNNGVRAWMASIGYLRISWIMEARGGMLLHTDHAVGPPDILEVLEVGALREPQPPSRSTAAAQANGVDADDAPHPNTAGQGSESPSHTPGC